jgi:hypothetical protein
VILKEKDCTPTPNRTPQFQYRGQHRRIIYKDKKDDGTEEIEDKRSSRLIQLLIGSTIKSE